MMTPEEIKAAARLTLRQFYEAYYDKSELAESTKQKYKYELQCWEKRTPDPPIGQITNDVVAGFRQAMIDDEYCGETINSYWTDLRGFLRLASPEGPHNPRGMDVIPRCPYMKPAIEEHGRPKRITIADLGTFYETCRLAKHPSRTGVEAPELWRTLVVLAYFTGLRKGDLLSLTHNQIELRESRFWFRASKTRKIGEFPLHPVAVEHLERIWHPQRERLFAGIPKQGVRFYEQWHAIGEASGIVEGFTPQDIRRTAGSEIERVKKGMAEILLQHYPETVTALYYLNPTEELGEAIRAMRFPTQFAKGASCDLCEPELTVRKPSLPPATSADEWAFRKGAFRFRGCWYPLAIKYPQLLEILVCAEGPLSWRQISESMGLPAEISPNHIAQAICELRKVLRVTFGTFDRFDPIPCVGRGDAGAVYAIQVPREQAVIPGEWEGPSDGE